MSSLRVKLQREKDRIAQAWLAYYLKYNPKIDWRVLSEKDYITWSFVRKHENLPWDFKGLSRNRNITVEIILANPGYPWDLQQFTLNPGIDWTIIRQYPEFPWDYPSLANHPHLSSSLTEDFPLLTWFDYLSLTDWPQVTNLGPRLTWEQIQAHAGLAWNYRLLSRSPLITEEIIRTNPQYDWSWYEFSTNPNFNPWLLLDTPVDQWDWFEVSRNPRTSLDFIRDHQELPWEPEAIMQRPDFTLDFCLICPLSWDWSGMSRTASWEDVKRYPFPWDYGQLSANPEVTWEIVQKESSRPWDWKILSQRLEIDWEIVLNHPELPWDYQGLLENEMNHTLRKISHQHERHLILKVQDKFLERLARPPLGYYFLKDLEVQLRDMGGERDADMLADWRRSHNHAAILQFLDN